MESKKSKPNQTNQTKVKRTNRNNQPTSDKLQTTQTNRHRNVLLLSISISLYLRASISPYLCAYLRAYSLPVQVYKCVMTVASVYAPSPPYLGA